jgi:hypothetical protein
MPKSSKRGGAKAHRKRVESRNEKVQGQKNAMQRLFEESMRTQIEEMKKKQAEEAEKSGTTETV